MKVKDSDDVFDHQHVSVTGPEVTSHDNHDKRDDGPTTVVVDGREIGGLTNDGPSATKSVATTKGGETKVKSSATTVTAKESVAKRLTSREGGKTPTTAQINSSRAIVEVLDRVDTPQLSTAVDGDGDGDVGGRNFGGEPTAFSVLPDSGRDDERPCECPNCCRRKPLRSTSSE